MTLDELIRSIHTLENYLQKFEEKYRLRSEDFYQLVQEGRLDQSDEFLEWLGVYEIKLKREQALRYFDNLQTHALSYSDEEVEADVERAIREVRQPPGSPRPRGFDI